MIYDAAIIGTGPAGVSAALTLAANNKNFLLIGSAALSDKVNRAEHIANYPGLPGVTGKEMNDVFRRQLEEAHIPVIDKMVTSIIDAGDHWALMAGAESTIFWPALCRDSLQSSSTARGVSTR